MYPANIELCNIYTREFMEKTYHIPTLCNQICL